MTNKLSINEWKTGVDEQGGYWIDPITNKKWRWENNETIEDIRYITFGCSESIHLYKREGGYDPAYPYKSHNSMDDARTYLTERGVKDIKIVKHYEE